MPRAGRTDVRVRYVINSIISSDKARALAYELVWQRRHEGGLTWLQWLYRMILISRISYGF